MNNNSRLVYSTEKSVSRKEDAAEKRSLPALPVSQQRVMVRLDRKARAGKSVTIVEGLQLQELALQTMLKKLKTGLGTGGTVKDGTLELQGDRCTAVIKILEKEGYNPKRSGA
ncbi:MAG: hypothetical protein RBT37_07815 [Dissulfurispiraceae bacterium]|jgi:translation initiation factor 1|nr:hypothetical protein [Dissulfurispiraceae bacterium]